MKEFLLCALAAVALVSLALFAVGLALLSVPVQ